MKKQIWLTLLAMLMVALACTSSSDVIVSAPNEMPDNGDGNLSQAKSTPTPPLGTSRSNPAPVGSVVMTEGMHFNILGITKPATEIILAGNMFNTEPEEGQEYIFIELQILCEGSEGEECNLYISDMKLVGSTGLVRDYEWLSGVTGLLESTDFYGGTIITGNVPFIINKDETDFVFVYDPFLGISIYLAIP